MGKKKVIKQTEEELLKETPELQKAAGKTAETVKVPKGIRKGRAYVQATYNNTIISIADEQGNVVAWASAGGLGFRGPKKATPYAASKVAESVVEKAKKSGITDLDIFVKGVGSGRESAVRSLANRGLNVLSIKDVTPVPHNGPRPPKVRRV